jgi:uncharacterized SAM-binding protein YcdF (DUF218 family)
LTAGRRNIAVAAAFLAGAAVFVLWHAGEWLVVQDQLMHAPAAVVFGGKTPFRAMEAARIYKAGWVREVWLTEGRFSADDAALEKLGIVRTPEHVYNRQVLERLGVPGKAIRVIQGRNNNTADEVHAISRALAAADGQKVILVTSSYHTRRVKALWHAIVGKRPEPIVRYTPDESFDEQYWWRDAADAWAVSREWFGLLNAWVGFPVTSEHW